MALAPSRRFPAPLVNVLAPQAAKTILGDTLGIKYIVDPGIEGKITSGLNLPPLAAGVHFGPEVARSFCEYLSNLNVGERQRMLAKCALAGWHSTTTWPALVSSLAGNARYSAAGVLRTACDVVALSPRTPEEYRYKGPAIVAIMLDRPVRVDRLRESLTTPEKPAAAAQVALNIAHELIEWCRLLA